MNEKSDREILLAVYQDVAALKAQVANACDDMSQLHRDYYGNGEGGTRRDVTALKTQMGMIIKMAAMLASSVIATAVAAIWALVQDG